MLMPTTIDVITNIKHNMKIHGMVHHVQTTPLFEAKDLYNNAKLFNGNPPWRNTLVLGEKTSRLGANMNPIVSRLIAIFQILNQM
jgi:hypothetical protein